MKKIAATAILSALLVSSAYAARTVRHPNLARAHKEVLAAFNSITAAQRANEFDLGGHAAKAKALLEQAQVELKQAVEAANDKR